MTMTRSDQKTSSCLLAECRNDCCFRTARKNLRVSFDQRVSIHELPSMIASASSTWYNSDEYKRIANTNKIILLKKMGHPKAATIPLGDESLRGLLWQLPERRKKRKVIYQMAIAAVVLQKRTNCHPSQIKGQVSNSTTNTYHCCDDLTSTDLSKISIDSLSTHYRRLCSSRAAAAFHRGVKDANAVLSEQDQSYAEDSEDDDTLLCAEDHDLLLQVA